MKGLPPVRIAHNFKLLSHTDLGGYPNAGEGIGIKVTPDGKRYLYLANEHRPVAFSILDVTDPTRPEVVWQLKLPAEGMRGNALALHGNLLLSAYQVLRAGDQPAGFVVYDVSDPVNPKEISFFDTSGPHSQGVHFIWFVDGRYAHISTGAADFQPNHPQDHQFYMIVDLKDPANPKEVGRWWMPGQRVGDSEQLPPRHPNPYDIGFRLHDVLCYPQRPDRAYLGYIDGGMVILDISDKSQPKMITRLDYHPPFPGFTHTVLPLFDRGLAVVTDEATGDEGIDWPKRLWMMDIREERNPVMIASMPTPEGFEDLHRVGGRIGAHNIHLNEPLPGCAKLQNTVLATWFSAGLRMYDISDPFRPEEIAAFLPETPAGQRGCRISDVFVDDRHIVYAADRSHGGLYLLEYTGDIPME